MPRFRYRAARTSGEVLEGEMEAGSHDAVIKRLQAQGHIPIRAEEIVSRASGPGPRSFAWLRARKVGRPEVAAFTLELATLLQAGLPLDRALEILVDLADSGPLRRMLTDVHDEVRRGVFLSDALAAQGGVFSDFYLNLVRAGEAGSALDETLARLAEFLERSRALKDSITDALIYPVILALFAVVSLLVILTFVVPRFATLFEDAGQALPWPTQVVVAAGAFMGQYWWAVAGVLVVAFLAARRQLTDPETRPVWDRRLLGLPLLGDLIAKVEVARFARTLGALIGNGVPLLEGLTIAREILGNRAIADGVAAVVSSVREGRGMAQALQETRLFPKLAGHMLKVGEETGSLEAMLFRIADTYDREVRTALHRLVVVMEPVIIIGLGLLVAGIILSILVAILSVNELAF